MTVPKYEKKDDHEKKMNIEIKKLSPELTEDYLRFFDTTPHSERPDEGDCKCYCVWWSAEKQDKEVFEAFLDTREKRREYARRKIAEGKIRGHLAYAGGKVVGWCNANEKSKCYECFCWSRFMKEISREDPSEKVMAVFCFAVSPEYRGMGIASALLSRVCEDAKEEGYSFVEAYPNAKFEDQAKDYMGPIGMYRKAGFSVKYSASGKKVVRKCVHREDK